MPFFRRGSISTEELHIEPEWVIGAALNVVFHLVYDDLTVTGQ
jgi:hypothetical protein|tara:strand:+ start:308 stop:436 length:129 start_codon:yes stop_codon:yes gene_type:complete